MTRIRIVIDAMGGDLAPGAVVRGALQALDAAAGQGDRPSLVFTGRKQEIQAALDQAPRALKRNRLSQLDIVDCPDVIDVNESPARAFRRKPDSSMATGLRLVKEDQGDAFMSAGSTGALMAGSLLTFGRIPGFSRPAIGEIVPSFTERPGSLLVDLGANVNVKVINLVEFAVMGRVYAEHLLGRPSPSVALLNIGTEANKGTPQLKQAYQVFQRLEKELSFYGNIEGRDLFSGMVDVIVCDGFIGNVVLKVAEGLGRGVTGLLRRELESGLRERAGALLARPAFVRVGQVMDYREYGGAPFLGINGLTVKCHGSSDASAWKNGIAVALKAVRRNLVDKIRENSGLVERCTALIEEEN